MNSESIRNLLISVIKVLAVILGILLLFMLGIGIGYSFIGKGSLLDVFSGEIWEHIFSFFS